VSASVPEAGDRIELQFGDDVAIASDVREQVGYAVWLSAPPVVAPGRRVTVRWQAGGRTVTATARVVRSTARQGLCLAIAAGRPERRRRGSTRHVPRERLRATLETTTGERLEGSVIDLSFGGCCVDVDAAATVAAGAVTLELARGGQAAGQVVDGLEARITTVERPGPETCHVHLAFATVGIAATRIAALLGSVQPARRAEAA
jgi:hypothetical protein